MPPDSSGRIYGRRWRLLVGAGAERVEITNLRVAFKIQRSHKQDPSPGHIAVYNLAESTRSRLATKGLQAQLEAGYSNSLPLIYSGGIERVNDKREGPDRVTILECDDGSAALAQARVSKAFKAGARFTDVFKDLADSLGVNAGQALEQFKEGNFDRGLQQLANGLVVHGPAREALDQLARSVGIEWSIQNGELVYTRPGQPLPGQVVRLAHGSGLIGTPQRGEQGVVRAKSLILAGIEPARKVRLESEHVSGFFRVDAAVYNGDSHGDEWSAELECRPL